MLFTVTVQVELSKVSGKFVSKGDVENEVLDAIVGADPGSVYVDESEYVIDAWDVTCQ